MGYRAYIRMLRIPHTIFSLPFAYVGALAAGLKDITDAIMIGVALFSARSVAILSNDLMDRDIDSLNPRTSGRPLITGEADPSVVLILTAIFSVTFILSALYFNILCFLLSFPILIAELSYPLAKRIHCFPHFHLGAILGFSPIAGFIAISNSLEGIPWGYSISLALWVAGFDMIYSMQDLEFDKSFGIKSVPSCFGEKFSLNLASICHISSFLILALSAIGPCSLISVVAFGLVLLMENIEARRGRYGEAFDLNIAAGLLLGFGFMLDYLMKL
ncbi:MAG: 4-hydroxybenzoate octaprenyltransferase [Candidatus Methanodesulfokora sp.]